MQTSSKEDIYPCVWVCLRVRGRVIYLCRQIGCCEELIMVQQSGARPCFSLIMGFHSLVHRLPMEPKCIKRRMDFHTRTDRLTHTHAHASSGSVSYCNTHSQPYAHKIICPWSRSQKTHLKHTEKKICPESTHLTSLTTMAHAAWVCCQRLALKFYLQCCYLPFTTTH